MPEESAFIFHHNFYCKPKVDLEDAEIRPEIKQKLTYYSKNHHHSSIYIFIVHSESYFL